MIALLVSAWRVVVKRSLADWLILSAALVTVLIATTLLAAGPIYADAVTLSGVHRTLADAPGPEVNLAISVRTNEENFADHDALVQARIGSAFNATGGEIYRRGISESYALPFQEDPENVRNLAIFSFFDRIQERTTLVEGAWPTSATEPLETAIPATTAALLGVGVGDEFQLTNRRDETFQPTIRIAGIFQIHDATDPYWFERDLDIDGVVVSDSFTTYGPFVVERDVFFGSLTPQSGEVHWNVLPTFPNLEVGEIVEVRRNVEALDTQLNQDSETGNRFRVSTDLATILREAERSLLVTRSGVLVLTIQLAILAGYALLLTAGLLVDQRGVETALIRSRGANNRQIATMAMMEGLLVALPAVLLGPPLAALSLRILNAFGPLADIGLTIDPSITSTSYLLALATGLACVFALTLPALIAARSFSSARAERGRQDSQAFSQRAGIDLVLLALAGLAYWQLRRYSAPITETVEGRLGIDPLLVSAPAIGLLAGAVIALRTIPLMARLSEFIATGGRKIVPALSAWQVARRPMRYARSALLLILAIGIGLFAVSYSETWKLSQGDQADYQIGADIQVTPNQRIGRSIPRHNLPHAYSNIEGVQTTIPVMRELGQLSRSAGGARAILLDTNDAAQVVQFRDDLSDEPFDVLMEHLAAQRPTLATLPIEGEPVDLAFDFRLVLDPVPDDVSLPEGYDPDTRESMLRPTLAVVLQDANGSLFRVDFGELQAAEDGERVEAQIGYPLGDGSLALPAYPLTLVDIEVRSIAPRFVARTGTLDILRMETRDNRGSGEWTQVDLPSDIAFWDHDTIDLTTLFEAPAMELDNSGDGLLTLRLSSGYTTGRQVVPITYYLRPQGTDLTAPIPVLVNEHFLAATASAPGAQSDIQIGDLRGTIEIAGVIRGFPTLSGDESSIIVADLPTVAMHRFEPGRAMLNADELWLSVDPAAIDSVATTLAQEPFLSRRVDSRSERAQTLLSDPVALGNIGSLSLGFVAAAIFAGIGFVVSAVVSARERMTEFALLRALGLSPRQLLRWMTLEHSVLVIVSLVGGTLLGLSLAWLVLPLISVTQQATRVVPEVIVIIPWRTIVLLELGVVLILAVSVIALALILRRVGLGSLLRLGGDN